MLIFGSSNTCIWSENSKTSICPTCKTKGSLTVRVLSNHTHFYWVPLFPIGKTGEAVCYQCKAILKHKQLPDDLQKGFTILNKQLRPKLWQYSGSVIGITLIIMATYIFNSDRNKTLNKLEEPMVGDIYQIKRFNNYSIMKAFKVTEDSVYVLYNNLTIGNKSEFESIDSKENYDPRIFPNSYENLKTRYKNGDIVGVVRQN